MIRKSCLKEFWFATKTHFMIKNFSLVNIFSVRLYPKMTKISKIPTPRRSARGRFWLKIEQRTRCTHSIWPKTTLNALILTFYIILSFQGPKRDNSSSALNGFFENIIFKNLNFEKKFIGALVIKFSARLYPKMTKKSLKKAKFLNFAATLTRPDTHQRVWEIHLITINCISVKKGVIFLNNCQQVGFAETFFSRGTRLMPSLDR